ncbi:MATE family efflux transporter [Parasphingorhabdus sp. DH2-15]|uniref:MATE family efflux transporter n=1 Tax=Parasphingorhabdus sp. DH2-15 TaxID=3444112 RepID=UPI003F686AB6
MRHVAVMTLTSSLGLVTMFSVDLLDLYFISLLGDPALTAAMGFAATLLFFNSALNIGLMIAISALASRMVGQGKAEHANALLTHVMALGISLSAPVAIIFWLFAPQFMDLIGAEGGAKDAAIQYIRIVAPFGPVTVCGMIASGFLRAYGDARRAMNTTLAMAITNAIFDPLLIFGFGLGFTGAAYATVLSIFAMAAFGLWPVLKIYGGFGTFHRHEFANNFPAIRRIMGPAILTNLATPVGGFITFSYLSTYSDDVIASYSVIGRIVPVAFCLLFSLSGAIGPIVGQNFGAGDMGRVRSTINCAIAFAVGYTLLIWPVLYILVPIVGAQFGLGEEGVYLLEVFAIVVVPLFLFNGILYISNAAFNNLDRANWSTWLNWGRNTIGILPFVYFGAIYAGPAGVVAAPALGGVVFGILGYILALRLIKRREADLATATALP